MDAMTPTLDAVCLAARIILENGGETYRAEETVERMCRGLNVPLVDVLALPTGLMLTLETADEKTTTRIVRVRTRTIHLGKIDRCNAVSRQVAQGGMDAKEALHSLKEIHESASFPPWIMIPASALSAAFFTVMLGGAWLDFVISFFCGALVQLITPDLSRHHVPTLISNMTAGAVVTLLALLGRRLFPGAQIEPVIAGAIMPLLPGLATTNAMRDTMRGDLVSGGARLMEAILCAVMLAAGIGLTLSVWGGVGL